MNTWYLTSDAENIEHWTVQRAGEKKLGEAVVYCRAISDEPLVEQLQPYQQSGQRFALLGIPEDIGPRANGGRGGAHEAWQAFLKKWLNGQDNRFCHGQQVLILGHVDVEDLMYRAEHVDVHTLREHVSTIDNRVEKILSAVFCAGLIPIVIGGGHNNALPILRALAAYKQSQVCAINLDPHLDFRPTVEGRHSGNPFSAAYEEHILKRYFVVGPHELYNSETMWSQLAGISESVRYASFDSMVRGEILFKDALMQAVDFVAGHGSVGIELDLDAIAWIPSSAATPLGVTGYEAAQYIAYTGKKLQPAYLHLPEGAPLLGHDGMNSVGKMLAYLVQTFIQSRL